MKTSRYTDSQIMAILNPAEAGTPVPELFRELVEQSGNAKITDLHVWRIGPEAHAAIVSVLGDDTVNADSLRDRLRAVHEVSHLTVEFREATLQDSPAAKDPSEAGNSAEIAEPTCPTDSADTPSGKHFISWLRTGIQSQKLIINDAKALVHTVNGTAYLISPRVFQRYTQEHPALDALAKADQLLAWQWAQKRFEKLGLQRKQPNGLNI